MPRHRSQSSVAEKCSQTVKKNDGCIDNQQMSIINFNDKHGNNKNSNIA